MLKREKILSKWDLVEITKFYRRILVLLSKQRILGRLKKYVIINHGVSLNKKTGSGSLAIIFTNRLDSQELGTKLIINIKDSAKEDELKIALGESFIKFKSIKFLFDNFKKYSQREKLRLSRYFDQIHPEALTLFPFCEGRGIDVGCGYRKTHPQAIGVDWIKKGNRGIVGNVKGKISVADIQTRGDDLKIFKDNSLDYVVSRHNLEHYKNPEKTLKEWLRVLKLGGLIGIVVPNSKNPQTHEETHYYDFTLNNFKEMIVSSGRVKIIKVGECIPNWSLFCIGKKINLI